MWTPGYGCHRGRGREPQPAFPWARALGAAALVAVIGCTGGCSGAQPCGQVCARVDECFGAAGPQDCRERCEAAQTELGEVGRAAVARCRDCVASSSCGDIAGSACADVCPSGWDFSGSDWPGPGCTETWDRDGVTYRLDCSKDSAYTCYCFVNGIEIQQFGSADICDVSADARRDRADHGCGWARGECSASWQVADQHRGVSCMPGDIDFLCTCLLGGMPYYDRSFSSTTFCTADASTQAADAEHNCHWPEIACSQEWPVGGVVYGVWCVGDVCTCTRDGGTVVDFPAGDFCLADHTTQTTTARASCGFPL